MSVVAIPRRRFDWKGFSKAITAFTVTHGLEEAFPVVDDGRVVSWQDHRDELLEDRDDLEGVPNSPLDRLLVGFDLFAQFTMPGDSHHMTCADGGVIDVPDLGDEGDDVSFPLTGDERRLAEKTVCDECHAYGYVISLELSNLVFQTVLFSDVDGDSEVEDVVEAGLAEGPMVKFIEKFIAKRNAVNKVRIV